MLHILHVTLFGKSFTNERKPQLYRDHQYNINVFQVCSRMITSIYLKRSNRKSKINGL